MDKKQLIKNLKEILRGDDELKKSRVMLAISAGMVNLTEKEKESILKTKPIKRRKSDEEEKDE
jgi:hypothetical protein